MDGKDAPGSGWLSRKRRRPPSVAGGGEAASDPAAPPTSLSDAPPSPSVPASLMPHLGWTKVTACHRPRKKRRRRDDDWDPEEGVRRIAGRAVFFLHDLRPEGGIADRPDQGKIWFQGRFFPSLGRGASGDRSRASPTSVLPEEAPRDEAGDSWGLLAVQNELVEECLACSEGGYREVDLTFVRSKGSSTSGSGERKKKARWRAADVIWTGGNMMALSSDQYSPYSLPSDRPGMRFEPRTLREGERAMEAAGKYFPAMARRLRLHDAASDGDKCAEAMVIVGDMEVMVPTSFARIGSVGRSHGGGNYSGDDDGLWSD